MDLASTDHLLTTTRAVRKRLDLTRPVPPALIEECIEIALQAPSGSMTQDWHFMVLTEEQPRRRIAELYQRAWADHSDSRAAPSPYAPDDSRAKRRPRVLDSATYLAEHIHEVPVLVIPCIQRAAGGHGAAAAQASLWGSILPATWSFMLAARSRGLGTAWTTIHNDYEDEAADALGMPRGVTQAALIPLAYYTGDDFRRASRRPVSAVTSWNRWGQTR